MNWPTDGPFIVVAQVILMAKLMIDGIAYDLLSRGDNNKVVALDDKRVGKLFELDSLCATDEMHLLYKARKINNLLVKGLTVKYTDNREHSLLVMERLYPLEHRAFSSKEKSALAAKFMEELKGLHAEGFAHWDIKRPDGHQYGGSWDNILVTKEAIRLIDCGVSVLNDHPEFEEACKDDIFHAEEWIKIFLS